MQIDKAKMRPPSPTPPAAPNARSGVFAEGYRGEYYNINIEKLIPFSRQPRKHFDQAALEDLAATIKRHGIRQPLTVIADAHNVGQYEVVSGERRLRAAKIAGLTKVPCIIIYDQKAALEISLIENIQREDLHPLDLAFAYNQLLEEGICSSHEEIAQKIGKSRSVITETIALLNLPDNIKTKLREGNFNNRVLFRKLAKEAGEEAMASVLDEHIKVCKAPPPSTSKLPNKGSASRRKILLKVIYDNGQIHIDTKSISLLSEETKQKLLEELSEIFQTIS